MTDAQLELARWLAGSDVWRGWCEAHPDERVPSVCPLLDDGWVDDSAPFARFWLRLPDVYLPRLDTSRLVGPLIEMLREVDGCPATIGGKGSARVYYFLDDDEYSEVRATDAEALCALLREVTE